MSGAGGLLVLCSATLVEQVRSAVSRHAPTDWGQARLHPHRTGPPAPRRRKTVRDEPCERCRVVVHGYVQLIAIATRSHPGADLRSPSLDLEALRPSVMFSPTDLRLSLRELVHGRLQAALEASGLDWLTRVSESVSRWNHGAIERSDVLAWLAQFEALHSNRWIGERLLRRLEFWTSPEVINALRIDDIDERGFECVAVNRRSPGKSADVIAKSNREAHSHHGLQRGCGLL